MRKKIVRRLGLWALILGIYPLFVLGYTWANVCQSDLKGGRHGPLDAYRHTLASAVVSYTLDESVVAAITILMESGKKDSNRMDGHNNRIGAQIGADAKSFGDIEPKVRKVILDGAINSTERDRISWLPGERWSNGRFW